MNYNLVLKLAKKEDELIYTNLNHQELDKN
jgi:hypothetical protein